MKPEQLLKTMFQAAVDAALPSLCVPAFLPARPKGRTIVIGAGKASGAMAKAFEDAWEGPIEGLVVTRYGYRVPTKRLEVVEAAHPVPDALPAPITMVRPLSRAGRKAGTQSEGRAASTAAWNMVLRSCSGFIPCRPLLVLGR